MSQPKNEPPEHSKEANQRQQALDQWVLSPQKMSPSIQLKSSKELLGDLLVSLKSAIPEMQVTLIVSIEGPILASKRFEYLQDERMIEAMTAALVSVAEQASFELNRGEPREFIIRSTQGMLFIKRLSEVHLLIALTQKGAQLELLEDAINQILPKIRSILKQIQLIKR